ncbi:MAG: alpha-ketoglutarate-dependent dioxygenase AlkB [Flavobacteriaceae bacterium]|nr:alpha-ketoglutarate-dependent dioxygenase AlkB [Flavobacteriaceae bacterium]
MDLFTPDLDPSKNYLPYDGEVYYWGPILDKDRANGYYARLMEEIAWKHDEAIIFGKHMRTARKVAWYADKTYEYTYSNIHRRALLWTPLLLEIKALVEQKTKQSYNACLLNLYHNGQEGVSWHSDDEKDLQPEGSIASLSFGAVRKFALKHKTTKEKEELLLAHGDLMEMKGATQNHWVHAVPKTKKVQKPRISLTFRQMLG